MSRRRPWLAAALAFVYPGLGHVYLREWLRALLWFLLSVSTAAYVLDDNALASTGFDVQAILDVQAGLPVWAAAALFAVSAFSIVDAYWLAARGGTAARSAADGATATDRCPNCRHRLEAGEYDFCPWCADEL